MEDRKLVTADYIVELNPIEGADRIEVAKVRNWNVVVGKGQFKVGDLVAYFEVDSALPVEDPRFSQFAERGTKTMPDGTKVHVLRTIKLRGQISQGLVMGLTEVFPAPFTRANEGDDLTDALGIQKWEPPLPAGNNAPKGNFPTQYADKTDSERVQNLKPRQWGEIQEMEWLATEKLDGTSVTIIKELDGTVRIASRNWEVAEGSLHYNAVMNSGIPDQMEPGLTVQGEIVGPGIQGNPLKLNETRIYLFSLWKDRQLLPVWPKWATGMQVPLLTLDFPYTIEEAIEQADGLKSEINPQVQAEGIVWHTLDGKPVPSLGRATWKSINNQFLVKQKG